MIISQRNLENFMKFNLMELEGYRSLTLGNGSIGGKARGLFFAKEVLISEDNPIFNNVVIPDSFFITTEIFDEFIDDNNLRNEIAKSEKREITYEDLENSFLKGDFRDSRKTDFQKILVQMDYPLAVRSSSLLEDSLKYAFAGKYLTTYITNRGSMDERLNQLETAIKKVFASTYGPNAAAYRKKHNLKGEKMAIIVQRLLGKEREGFFYPEIAGVAFSRNYRRWSERIKQEDGVIRMVFGLGTKCTGRGYAKTYSLTNLALSPEGNNTWEIAKYSQETYDSIDMKTGEVISFNINERINTLKKHENFRQFVQMYDSAENRIKDVLLLPSTLPKGDKLIFTFNTFPKKNPEFFQIIEALFKVLEREMGTPVDIEFTYETSEKVFGLIQARPLSSYEDYRRVKVPPLSEGEAVLLKGDRMLTNGQRENVRYLVYVDHDEYYASADKYFVAREIGRINSSLEGENYILVGPGRWGSSNKLLGVPVNYNEISNCSVLVELGIKKHNFVPELSYGTHFFADLDVDGVLYMPVFDFIETNFINEQWFKETPFEKTDHPAVRIYKGNFGAYFDGQKMEGVIVARG